MKMQNRSITRLSRNLSIFLTFIALAVPGVALADEAPPKAEVLGYGGGVAATGGGGSHAIAGAAVGGDIAARIHIFGEFNYVPLGSASLSGSASGVSYSASASDKMIDFGGGVNIHGGPRGARIMPYVTGVAGVGHQSLSGSGYASGSGASASANLSMSENSPYFGGGGGVRIFVGKRWGVRPEFRYQRYTSSGGGNMVLFTVGVFGRFGK